MIAPTDSCSEILPMRQHGKQRRLIHPKPSCQRSRNRTGNHAAPNKTTGFSGEAAPISGQGHFGSTSMMTVLTHCSRSTVARNSAHSNCQGTPANRPGVHHRTGKKHRRANQRQRIVSFVHQGTKEYGGHGKTQVQA